MDTFNEYDKASKLKGKTATDTVPAATITDKQAVNHVLNPQASDKPSTTLLQAEDDETRYIIKENSPFPESITYDKPWLFWLVVILLVIFAAFAFKFCTIKEVASSGAQVAAGASEIKELKAEVKELRGQLVWVRKLLQDEKIKYASMRTHYEQVLSEAEQWRLWSIDALKAFYETPFAEGEGSRQICFSMSPNDEKCYQLTSPAIQSYQETVILEQPH